MPRQSSQTTFLEIDPIGHIGGVPQYQAPESWGKFCANTELSLHQLSPYIGKLKSSIASDLIRSYSKVGDTVADLFCGSGTVVFEALAQGRHVVAADCNPYAVALTKAKLNAPDTEARGLEQVCRRIEESKGLPKPDLRKVPPWVRKFFHGDTLRDVIKYCDAARNANDSFSLAVALGILHHQRPGFLSYPSSHLVPYLRTNLFPPASFPEMYQYRELEPRLIAKIRRLYKRPVKRSGLCTSMVYSNAVEDLRIEQPVDCIITSPPYMNALDYGRDNRLRLWFSAGADVSRTVDSRTNLISRFGDLLSATGTRTHESLRKGGYCLLVIGELGVRSLGSLIELLQENFESAATDCQLVGVISDSIPDIRRARRDKRGVKKEHVFIYRRAR